MTRTSITRALAVAALIASVAAAGVLVFGGGAGPYRLRVEFENAGQLVKGGLVQVAGRKVGSIDRVSLTDDGLAEIHVKITDDRYRPLTTGTSARIRALGQAGISNRYVELVPGAAGLPQLRDGAVLRASQTAGIVDLDAVLDAFDPPTRADVRTLIARSSEIFAGSGAATFNHMLAKLDPGLGAVAGLSRELEYDSHALGRLIRASSVSASAVASRESDLRAAVVNTATTMRALARERRAIGSVLARAPNVLRRGDRTLRGVNSAVTALRPALRAAVPAAKPLEQALRAARRALPATSTTIAALNHQLPGLRHTFAGLTPLAPRLVKASSSAHEAVFDADHILSGLRAYGPDLILGVINGLAGISTGGYGQIGHYVKLSFVQSLQTFLGGGLATLLTGRDLIPGIIGVKTKQLSRCPGGNAPPAPDGSNPWVYAEGVCNPAHNLQPSVNEP